MTTPRKRAIAEDRVARRPKTLREDLAAEARALLDRAHAAAWPTPRWRDDPAAFALHIFGVRLMLQQVDVLLAIRDHKKVAVRSGNKAGKTITVVLAALWFFCTFPDARVVLTATTGKQVEGVLWRQLKALIRQADQRYRDSGGAQGAPAESFGKLAEKAFTGLKAADLREIVGQTAAVVEAISGVSGANLLYIVDEASSLEQRFMDAIEGNRAGGLEARLVMISNPARVEGPFFEAFHVKKSAWHTIAINCEDVAAANVDRIPGIADAHQIELWAEQYGRDSVFYRVRVKGEFCLNEGGKAIPFGDITKARDGWEEAKDEGLLCIGLDPAGPGQGGDDTAFALVRGKKCLDIPSSAGLNEDAIIDRLLGLIRVNRRDDETPRVVVDMEGPIGSRLYGRLLAISDGARPGHGFDLFGVKASNHAEREPHIFDRIRDELWASLAKWLKEGGTIPPDPLLEGELYAPNWIGTVQGKLKLTPKDEIRKMLRPQRSPDRADALALAVWQPAAWSPDEPPAPPGPTPRDAQDAASALDMQGGNDVWWPDGSGG